VVLHYWVNCLRRGLVYYYSVELDMINTCWRSTLTRDQTNLQYISEGNPHLKSQFCKNELNSLFDMILEFILAKFVGLIMPFAVGLLINI